MKKIRVISLVVSIMIMALIFFFSSQNAEQSSEVSNGLTKKIVEIFQPHKFGAEKVEAIISLSYFVRKAAHFSLFTMLGLSVITTVTGYICKSRITNISITMTICVIYACFDEFHQRFVGGRSMQFSDVLIDSAGALFGIVIFFVLYRIYKSFRLRVEKG